MADGFASKQTQGAGNKFYECRAWENSDDGFDAFDSPDSIIVIDSWAFRNGINVFGADSFTGNGNGFKLGGNSALANNRCTRCVAFGNPSKGFDQNNNTGGITVEQSIGYANGINFGMVRNKFLNIKDRPIIEEITLNYRNAIDSKDQKIRNCCSKFCSSFKRKLYKNFKLDP